MTHTHIRYPVTEKALNSKRKHSVSHKWNRGYPNNRRLAEALKEKGEK